MRLGLGGWNGFHAVFVSGLHQALESTLTICNPLNPKAFTQMSRFCQIGRVEFCMFWGVPLDDGREDVYRKDAAGTARST